jgi:c-di-GMP-binding flagellar brake protein YcgR
MDLMKFLKTGGRARIYVNNHEYQTIFDDVQDSEHMTFMIPSEYRPFEGEEIIVSCITEVGLLLIHAQVIKVIRENATNVMMVKVTEDIKRIQNRAAYRAKVSVEVLIKVDRNAPDPELEKDERVPRSVLEKMREIRMAKGVPEGWIKTYTINISETGMLVRVESGTKLSGDLELILRINQYGMHELLTGIHGRLARCFVGGRKETDLFAGIQFVEIPDRAKTLLMKLVFQSQRTKKDED